MATRIGKGIALSLWCAAAVLWLVGCCPRNPRINTAASVHGNTDWHINTAEEFLTGKNMDGVSTATNHCPATWETRHLHVGLTNTNHYYYDADKTSPGDDADSECGIDQPMLLFYAGHGWPESWDTLGNEAVQGKVKLGNCEGGGLLRYYWQCSCEVFAHGAVTCPGGGMPYACPSSFDGSADSEAMRNVFERWGPVLTPDLRMACGSSTSAYCWTQEVNRIWDNYNNLGYDVLSSFIYGMRLASGVVPLCITKGGEDLAATPFFDTTFTNQRNTSGSSYYYIAYLEHLSGSGSKTVSASPEEIPAALPVLTLAPMALPARLQGAALQDDGNLRLSQETVGERGARARIDRRSGAVYLRGTAATMSAAATKSAADLERTAQELIRSEGWDETGLSAPEGLRIMIAREPAPGHRGTATTVQKNAVFTYAREIEIDGVRIPVLGEGGKVVVQLNNDGTLLNAAKVWRQYQPATGTERRRVKTYNEAYQEAMAKVEHADRYKVQSWRWGYWEEAGNVVQDQMSIVFVFELVPINHQDTKDYPPIRVTVAGQA